ncbi:MAG: hypothetical protein EOP39_32900, partial [Rubrivivax sp.]
RSCDAGICRASRYFATVRLADTLKAEGVPVARRTVAKYREALQIPASHERVRIG